MPYIKAEQRVHWDKIIADVELLLSETGELSAGELNYFVSSIIWRSLNRNKCYAKANELIGALECIKQEFYRRQIAPYEDAKVKENGDL